MSNAVLPLRRASIRWPSEFEMGSSAVLDEKRGGGIEPTPKTFRLTCSDKRAVERG